MSRLQISFACCPYDRLNPIIAGRVPIEGCDSNFFPLRPEELFPRVYSTQDFDVTELSASSHILTRLRGDSHYVGIPAFVSRVFSSRTPLTYRAAPTPNPKYASFAQYRSLCRQRKPGRAKFEIS